MAGVCKEVRAAGLMIFRIVNQKIEYLLLQASYLEHHWTAPKGHVDPGETDELVTAKRETEEEAGLRPDNYEIVEGFQYVLRVNPGNQKPNVLIDNPVFPCQYTVKNKPKIVTYWAAKVKDPQVIIRLSNEHIDFRWCNLSALMNMTDKNDMKDSYKACEKFMQNRYNLPN